MDAARYARVRELFLAADEMSPEDQRSFLRSQTQEDNELYQEVWSLLGEHNPEAAKREGDHPSQISYRPAGNSSRITPLPGVSEPSGSNRGLGDPNQGGANLGEHQSKGGRGESRELPERASITRPAAPRTHASPKHAPTLSSSHHVSKSLHWAQQTRRSRRRNNTWLWLAALLPTALIGWFTYRQVNTTMEQSVRDELRGIADSVSHASRRFLVDKSRLVESWSRQPGIHTAIIELADLADANPTDDQLRQAGEAERIESQLQQLSGLDGIKFVVWSDNFRTLASSDSNLGKVGSAVEPSHAMMLARVMRGETVVFGPERTDPPRQDTESASEPPVMAIVVPIPNKEGRIVAAFMVGGIGMFEEFSRMYFDVASAGKLDAYAVNQAGIMVTESPHAATLASMTKLDATVEEIAARLRVADPGEPLDAKSIEQTKRNEYPLTHSVASATAGSSEERIVPYRNYAGEEVVGAWRWNSDSELGIIVERQADAAFATVRIVRSGFLLLGTLLFITATMAAAFLARASTAERFAVHPLSRYEVLRELGSGGMGVVYLARHRQLGRDTALKVMIGSRRHKEDQLRFDREARLAASLSSPHSVMIYDYGRSEDGESYCVMEFLRGLTLHEVVERSGPQPIGRVLFILSQVCEALAEAHELNLLHRDIKPQNIMLSLDQSVGDWAVLFDYGLAKPLESVADVYQTSEAHWSGTPMYMAPERFRHPNAMDRRSDIYSLGCVAYYLLSGRPPYVDGEAESLFALILGQQPISLAEHRGESVPAEITQLVSRCMSKSADERFASIAELAKAINAIRRHYPWTVDEARQWWSTYGDE